MYLGKNEASASHIQMCTDVESTLHRVIHSLETAYPQFQETWRNVNDLWTGRVVPGAGRGVVYEDGTVYIAENTKPEYAFSKSLCLLIAKNTPGYCQNELLAALDYCRTLRIRVDLTCDDIMKFGLSSTPFFDSFYCDSTLNRGRVHEYDNLIGHDVNTTMKILHENFPEKQIHPVRWDIIESGPNHGENGRDGVLDVTYDSIQSHKTVWPPPRARSMEKPYDFQNRCFMRAENGQCVQTPRTTSDLRRRYVGKPYTTVYNSLRYEFPHTAFELVYFKARIERDERADRILLLVDDDMNVANIIF